MKKLLLLPALLLISVASYSQCTELFFSEYLEGSSNNKAIEIYNPTNATVNLTNYKIYRYNNGSPTPTDSLSPQGTLAPDSVFVAGNPTAVAGILAVSDTLHTITFYNGDDAMVLKNIVTNTVLDIIGIIGVDPGTNWPVGTGATSEFTLVRMVGVQAGTTNWAIGATQYDVHPQNTITFLGSHTMTPCCSAPVASVSNTQNVNCFGGNNGQATVQAVNGNTFTYSWAPNTSTTTATAANLSIGTYTCIVTNECGLSDTVTVTITEPALIAATFTNIVTPGCNQANGSITIVLTGGTPPYTYQWSNGGTTATISNLTAGVYTCVIIDGNGCGTQFVYSLANSNPPVVSLQLTSADTVCLNTPAFALGGGSPAGGTWSGPGVTGSTFNPSVTTPGMNYITYTYVDSSNCTGTATDSIFVDVCTGVETAAATTAIRIYPNPANEVLQFSAVIAGSHIRVYDAAGRIVLAQTAQRDLNVSALESGSYMLTISNAAGEVLQRMQFVKN
ncbi:MAG: T9SS type A sorting domain-containing protein [Bacteroidia bacterium]